MRILKKKKKKTKAREDVRAAEEEASNCAKVRAEDLPFVVATDYYMIF